MMLMLTTGEMLSHLKEVFYDYDVKPINDKWTTFTVSKGDNLLKVYTYSDCIKDDYKVIWYFNFYNIIINDGTEIVFKKGISTYFKYLFESYLKHSREMVKINEKFMKINDDDYLSIIREWKLKELGLK